MAKKIRIPRVRFASEADSAAPYSPVATYYMILIPALILAAFGLLMTFSASAVTNISEGLNPYLVFSRNLIIILGSVTIAAAASFIVPSRWRRWSPWIFGGAVIFQLMVVPFGVAQGGNQNWIRIPVVNQYIQPAELLKLALCLFLAMVLANLGTKVDDWRAVAAGVGLPSAVAIGAVLMGHDLGTALVFVASVVGMLWVAGAPSKWFPSLFMVMAAASAFLVAIKPSRLRRVLDIIPGLGASPDPAHPTQPDQGLWALGSGGLFGLGPGASRAKWNYLQEAHNDFILAIVGEEFGLVGTLSLLITMGVLVWGILRLAANSTDAFVRICSGGVASWLISQSLINVASVTGLGPVVGVPFPFVSHGGSSFLFTAIAIGVVLAFARYEAEMTGRGRFDADTGGRDPRVSPKRRSARPGSNRPFPRAKTNKSPNRSG